MTKFLVQQIQGPQDLTERLLELGFSEGESFEVIRQFPFQGPWVLMTRFGMVALRDEEFQCLKTTGEKE
jgi:Fe2+ transport system protein FeoA